MHLQNLHIDKVRNLSKITLDLGPGLNLLIGPNGAGKTAILEAIHTLIRGRSFRTPKTSDLLQHDQSELLVRGKLLGTTGEAVSAGLTKHRNGTTQLRINGERERKLSELARRLPLQVMLPGVSDLVFGSPGPRRRFLDWGVFHVEHTYNQQLQSYNRALKQRNALLKSAENERSLGEDFDVWNAQVAESGKTLTLARRMYLERWQPIFAETLGDLSGGFEVDFVFDAGFSEDEDLLKLMSRNLRREVKYGVTQAGPHRADLQFRVGSERASAVLSRGQGKTLALALLIGQAKFLMESKGVTTTFLIDDVGAELDGVHNLNFFSLLQDMNCQILATATDMPRLGDQFSDGALRVFHVEHGAVST